MAHKADILRRMDGEDKVKDSGLVLSDKCPKCGTTTLELDQEGDVHCWACGRTFGKPRQKDLVLERRQLYAKNKDAILKDVQSLGRRVTAAKWKVSGASLSHTLNRWEREAKEAQAKEAEPAKKDYLLERHQFYEKNKAAILADVERIGASATARKWKINGASLYHVLQRWDCKVKKKPKRNRRGRNYEQLPGVRKHLHYEENKDAIVADLLQLGRDAVCVKWDYAGQHCVISRLDT